jgi:hypothetical protein
MKILASIYWKGRITRGFFHGVPLPGGRWGVYRDDLMAAFQAEWGHPIPDGCTYSIGL